MCTEHYQSINIAHLHKTSEISGLILSSHWNSTQCKYRDIHNFSSFLRRILSYRFRQAYIVHISAIAQYVTRRTSIEIGTHQYVSPETKPCDHQCHISSK